MMQYSVKYRSLRVVKLLVDDSENVVSVVIPGYLGGHVIANRLLDGWTASGGATLGQFREYVATFGGEMLVYTEGLVV